MKRAFLILAAITCFAVGPARAGGLDEARSGADALALEDFQVAVLHYTAAIRSADLPADQLSVSYRQRGIAYIQLGRADFAVLDFTSALWLGGLDGDLMTRTFYNRGLAYEMLDETKLAIADLTTAIGRNTSYAEAYNSRGHMYRKLGQYEQALADFAASTRQGNPEPHLPMYGMALTYEAMGRSEDARAWYRRALMMKPDFDLALEKLTPGDIASDAGPVAQLDSEELVPEGVEPSSGATAENAPAQATGPAAPITEQIAAAEQASIDALKEDDGSGGPLVEEGEIDNSLPTLVDEPAPPEVKEREPSRSASVPAPQFKPPAPRIEPAAAPPQADQDTLRSHVPSVANRDTQVATVSPSPSGAEANDYQVQLGSYASRALAEKEARKLKRDHPLLFETTNAEVQEVHVAGRSYYRLRGSGLTRDEASRLCKGLRQRDINCTVARP